VVGELGILGAAFVHPVDERLDIVARTEDVGTVVLQVASHVLCQGHDQPAAVLVGHGQFLQRESIDDLELEDEILDDHGKALLVRFVDVVLSVQVDCLVLGDAPRDEGECPRDLLDRTLGPVIVPSTLDSQRHLRDLPNLRAG
jgi:hypothetical protein